MGNKTYYYILKEKDRKQIITIPRYNNDRLRNEEQRFIKNIIIPTLMHGWLCG